jgi:sugar-specific transcriptional regulator TrmB
MDKAVLIDLGLTNNEVEVYLSLLRQGNATANEVAKKCGLHRQAVYDALERLLEKDFASFFSRNNVRHFQPLPPSKIVDFLDEKKQNLELLMPELLKIAQEEKETVKVEVFKGKSALRTFFRENIKEVKERKESPLIYGVEEKRFHQTDKIAIEKYLNELRRLNVKEKVLVKDEENYFVEGAQTVYKKLPEKFFSSIPISVCGSRVFMHIWGEPIYLIIIESEKLAESYKKQFNALWKMAKPVRR